MRSTRSRLSAPTLAAALALGSALSASAQDARARMAPADSLAAWYALGIGAHHLCAGTWVVGRDHERAAEEVVAEDIAHFPAFRWQDDYRYVVDPATKRATVSAPGIGSRTAKYSGDQGCAILPANATDVFYRPADVVDEERRADDVAWPTGDRDAHARLAPADSAAFAAILDWAFDDGALQRPQNTRGIVVIHDGRIVAERYAPGWGPYTPQLSWSMGKSIAATLIGVLAQDGLVDIDAPAPLEEWSGERDPRRDIRIRDLLRMSSGLDFDNFGLDPRTSYIAANEHFRIYFDALDVAAHAVDQPARYVPGEVWRYRNSDPLTLMEIARRAVEARGQEFLAFPQRRLFDRIGARSFVLETDAWGNFVITGFDFGGTRDWARLGLLYLNDGVWQGERILAEGFTEFVRTPAPGDPSRGYGGLFWLNRGGAMDRLPPDAYWMAGYMGQTTMIIPSRDLVVVRQGPSPGGDGAYFEELVARVLEVVGTGGGARQ